MRSSRKRKKGKNWLEFQDSRVFFSFFFPPILSDLKERVNVEIYPYTDNFFFFFCCLIDSASNHGFPKSIAGGLSPEKNGKGEDRDQEDRKHHEPAGYFLQEAQRLTQEGL